MSEAGVLTEDDRVELLDGWVVPKMPQSARHAATIGHAQEILRQALPEGYHVRVQSPVATPESEPEPDLAVVNGPASRYTGHHPGAGEVPLVVEVADSSIERDRGIKAAIYSRAGFPLYWILNLANGALEAHSAPSSDGYRRREILLANESVSLDVGGGEICRIGVATLLPP